jgi:uncharacterized protein involved in outer membrane biogenesis
MWTFLKWTAIVCTLLVVGIVLFIIIFDWNWARGIVASKASKAIGRGVIIAGDLDIDWSWQPTIHAADIRVVNAAWSPEPYIFTLRQLALQVDLRALLKGQVVLPMVELQEPVVLLESSAEGIPNWLFSATPETSTPPQVPTPPTLPTIGQVALHAGRYTYHDYSTDNTFGGTLSDLRAQTVGPEQSIEVRGAGEFEHIPFALVVHAGALPALQADNPYPLQVQLTFGAWYTQLDGTLLKPLELAGVDLEVLLERGSAEPTTTSDASASHQPPYRLTGHLSRPDGAWEMKGLQGTLGDSNISAGHLVFTIQDQRPLLQANLASDTFNVDQLLDTLTNSQASANTQDTEPNKPSSGPLLDVEVTRAIDVLLNFQGQNVIMAGQTLNNVSVVAELRDGHLTLKPAFALAGGSFAGQIDVTAQDDIFQSAIHADVDNVDVRQVLARFTQEGTASGIVKGRIDLTVSGRTLSEMLTSVAGKVSLSMTDAGTDTDVAVNFATLEGDTQDAARLVTLEGGGRMRGQPVQLKGRVGSLHAWHIGTQPYPVQATVRLGETQVQVDGTLKQPQQFTSFTGKVALQGPDPATLATFLPVPLPHLPPYQFTGQLESTEKSWQLTSFKVSLGHSDMTGTLALDVGGARPFLRGALRSQHLRLDELMDIMAQNQTPAAAPQKKSPAAQGEVKRAIVDVPFDPKLLQRLDTDLRFQGQDLRVSKLSLTNVAFTMHMANGHLKLTPQGELEGGTIRATIEAYSRQEQVAGRIQVDITQVDLNSVLSKFDFEREAFGRLNGHIDLTGTGQSLATWLATANGDVSLTMAGGQLHGLLIELVGLDVAESIAAAFSGKEARVPIRCLLADFMVSDGKMQTQMLVFDTTDTKILGEGFIDLGEELVHLKLVPEAKDFSIFSAEAPMYLKGPLSKISAGPKIGEVLLSLAMPIKIGKRENVDCQALFDAIHKQQEPSKR